MGRTFTRLRDVWRGRTNVEVVLSVPPSSPSAPPRVLDDPIPVPPEIAADDSADFRSLGEELYRYLLTFCRVAPSHWVLDVSCRYAPAARPLSRWLIEGAYDGVDWDRAAIEWCRDHISPRFPNFRFRLLQREGGTLKYPHSGGAFHAVLVWDVLTRTLTSEVEQHVAETARVLRPGRHALLAFYLLNDDSRARVAAGAARLTFVHRVGAAFLEDRARPAAAAAYDEEWVRGLLERHELELVEPVQPGRWAGRADGLAEADLVVARKRTGGTARRSGYSKRPSEIPLPPEDLHHVGHGDFLAVGRGWRTHFIELADLKRFEDVLDVGCGVGRIAIPLTEYLTSRYEGFDISPAAIAWCRENITSRYPNFHFTVADIGNTVYNRDGDLDAATFVFPYDAESFDFVFLTSVFTHMLPDGVENYAREIRRVLRPGGRCFSTWLLVNDEYRRLLAEGQAPYKLPCDHGCYRTEHKDRPEAVVGYDEAFARQVLEEAGLEITGAYPGRWSSQDIAKTPQDSIIAMRPREAI